MKVSGECNLLGFVSSQQKFEATDIKVLGASQLSDSVIAPSGGTNTPQVFTQGRPRGEEETYKKRSQRTGGLSLSRARAHSLSFSLFASFGLARPHTSRMYFPLFSK